jgi:hypothetical protein
MGQSDRTARWDCPQTRSGNSMQQEGKGALGDDSWLGLLSSKGKGKKWADVEILKCGSIRVNAENSLGIGEFCRCKYIIYTESKSPVHPQMCLSLLASPLSAVTFASIPFKGSHLLEYSTTPQGICRMSRCAKCRMGGWTKQLGELK